MNNVLASMTDKIVCATFSADPSLVEEEAEEDDISHVLEAGALAEVEEEESDEEVKHEAEEAEEEFNSQPMSSLALAAAPLLTSNFTFDTRGLSVLNQYSAPSSRRCSDQHEATTTAVAVIFNMDSVYQSADAASGHRSQTSSVQNLCCAAPSVSPPPPCDDSSVHSAQITPQTTPGRSQSLRSNINTDDRDKFTEEVTV